MSRSASALEVAMARALDLAARPGGRTSPNPNVGAVALDETTGATLAEGFHRAPGLPHAESALLEDAARRGVDLRGSTLVCTLEPCAHHGRTPPCAPLVAATGFTRAAVALSDPNPLVGGRGLALLRERGLEVVEGVAARPARRLLEGYLHWLRTRRPFVHLKMAMLPDGTVHRGRSGPARISGEESRRLVHRWRHLSPAVMVGAGTVRIDDPRLTARDLPAGFEAEPWQPRRVVLASRFDLPASSRALAPTTAGPRPLVIGSRAAPRGAEWALEGAGVETARVAAGAAGLDLAAALERLGEMGLTSVLVEGGPRLADALLAAGLVNRLSVLVTPEARTAGDSGGAPPARARSGRSHADRPLLWLPPGGLPFTGEALREREVSVLGEDRLVTGLLGGEGRAETAGLPRSGRAASASA